MGVNLFAVLLLQAEHHLYRRKSAGAVIVRPDQLLIGSHGKLGSVLELDCVRIESSWTPGLSAYDVSNCFFSVNILLHDTVLVDANGCEEIKRALVARVDTVENQANNNFLPSRATLVPKLRFLQVHDITDVLHDTVESSRRQNLIFVVVCDGDEQLSVSVVHSWPKIIAVLERKIIGIAGSRGV